MTFAVECQRTNSFLTESSNETRDDLISLNINKAPQLQIGWVFRGREKSLEVEFVATERWFYLLAKVICVVALICHTLTNLYLPLTASSRYQSAFLSNRIVITY